MSDQRESTIGATLREARERAGLSLRQIADTTKLSVHVLTLLEQNRIAQLPGGIYRRSIVRAFASEVGLDAEKTLRQFLEQYPDDVPVAVYARPETAPGRSRRVFRALVSTFGAAIPIAAGIYYFTSSPAASRTQTSVAARRATERPVSLQSPDSTPARVVRPDDDDHVVSMTVSTASRTRLQVIADGQEILARPIEAGEEVRLEFSTDVVVKGDDAGVVHVTLNGRDTQALGDPGAPLSIRIPRDSYRDWLRPR